VRAKKNVEGVHDGQVNSMQRVAFEVYLKVSAALRNQSGVDITRYDELLRYCSLKTNKNVR
jgi:hypothetical protein